MLPGGCPVILADMILPDELLNSLMGRRTMIHGADCEVIEVLNVSPMPRVVLGEIHGEPVIQADQHGEPHRRVMRTYTVPLQDAGSKGLHPVILSLSDPSLTQALLDALRSSR